MAANSDPEVADTTTAPKKRKRSTLPAEGEELEIDINLPEPPSKKALRRQKKGKSATTTVAADTTLDSAFDETPATAPPSAPTSGINAEEKRSPHGIWIGNLAFSIDKSALKTFLTSPDSGLEETNITRVHMPAPPGGGDSARRLKPQNKGFAYVDFDSADAVKAAIALSEGMLMGRRVLIKDATSFAGRPVGEKSATRAALGLEDKNDKGEDGKTKVPERSKRIFVGNLGFDVLKEDLESHFAQAGEVEDVFLATFQDSGKCKGYGWIRFSDEDAAEAAVKGFVFKDMDGSGSEDEDEEEKEDVKDEDAEEGEGKKKKRAKKQKKRKWFINRLNGRTLRCEYAEDSKTRYTKRFGKGAPGRERPQNGEAGGDGAPIQDAADGEAPRRQRMKGDKDQRQEQRRLKHVDARKIRPGAALANAPRASGAIAESQGKKITFDE
ncbi:hypothetical protein MBLNU457_7593t1 [Dothideomycetes sp. NU457]